MATELTVNGSTFNFPTSGTSPNWAEELSGWAEAVTDVLDTLNSGTDIITTSTTIANNQSSATNVTGLLFDTATVRGATIQYTLYRKTDSATSGHAENGSIFLVYDNSATSGNKWTLSQTMNGTANVVFSITDAGQLQYISSNISGANYIGTMKFNAKTFVQ